MVSSPISAPLVGCRPWEGPFSAATHPAGDRIRSHTRVSCITLRSLAVETSVRPASPLGQSSPAFPCPAAQQPVPILLMSSHVAPRHGQPETTADRQRRTAAPNRQLSPPGPRGPQGHPAAPRSWGQLLRGPGAGLGRRPLTVFTPFHTQRVTRPIRVLSHGT